MKLTIKSLKQVPYDVEVETDQVTVKELKQEVEKRHGFDHSTLKLVFNGVVLDDAKKLVECNLKEGNVVVMMNAKAKPVNVQKEEAKKEESIPQTTTTTTTTSIPSSSTTSTVNRPQAQPKDYTTEVASLMEMGFPKAESEAAIKAARGNLNVAIEFLYNGIPENLPPENVPLEGGDPNAPQAVIKNISSIVKVLCYNNPSQLQNILVSLQQSSPEIMELIRENEDEFKNLIQQPITDEDVRAFQEFNRQARGESGLGGQAGGLGQISGQRQGGQGGAGGREVIRLSKQDYDAVGRLKELGFSEMDAVQAYFACDKNEDAAANFLWESKLRDQDQEIYIDCKHQILLINILDSQIGGGAQNEGQSGTSNQGVSGTSSSNQTGSNQGPSNQSGESSANTGNQGNTENTGNTGSNPNPNNEGQGGNAGNA